MDTFNWTSFTKKIAIKSTVSELYDAWTIPQKLENWFLSEAIFERPHEGEVNEGENLRANDSYRWSWYLFETVEKGKIIDANGVNLLKFTFAGDCVVEVMLTQIADHTVVELTQSNIPTDDQSKRGIRLGCDSGWSFFLLI